MARGASSPGKGGLKARQTTSRQPPAHSPGKGGLGAKGAVSTDALRNAQPLGAKPGLVRTVTGAVSGTGSRIRLTVTAHGFDTGQQVTVAAVGGVPAATGQWTVVVVTANTIELAGSTFSGGYTSGGTASRF
jgi:hypothetical protein